MDTDSFILYVETEDFYKDIGNDVNKWFYTSNYSKDINRPLEKGKNKKFIGKFKDELGGLVMSKFCAHRAKTYAFLFDDFTDYDYVINKKAKGTKKCVIQNQITFNDYVNVLFNKTKLIKSQFGFRSRNHEVDTEKINKIALSSNGNKRIQCYDNINTYPYGYDRIDKHINEYDNLIEKVHKANNKSVIISKDTDTLLEDVDMLLNRTNKLKDKSKKRMEQSNKLLEDYINDKIDKNIEKSKIITDTCEINILIESTNELIKRTDDNCEKTDILLHDIKKLNDKVKKKSKKGITKSNELLKSFEVNNNNANTLIKKLKTINKDDNLNKRGVG